MFVPALLHAEDKPAEVKPLKILLIDGGGYHDYGKQGPFLSEKLKELVNCQVDVVSGGKDAKQVPEIFSDPKFADAYDVVVYDLCYATDGNVDPKNTTRFST